MCIYTAVSESARISISLMLEVIMIVTQNFGVSEHYRLLKATKITLLGMGLVHRYSPSIHPRTL